MTINQANDSLVTNIALTDIDVIKKAIYYRAHHRGTKEADWIIGGFVRANLDGLLDREILAFKDLVDMDDESFFRQVGSPESQYQAVIAKFVAYKDSL